jgi:outer membrane receptor protein involved in Fe transport
MFATLLAACYIIGGNVHAISGAPLAAANLILHGATTASTTSDAKGDFSIEAAPGSYELTSSSRGFATIAVTVNATQDVRLEVAMEPLDSPKLRQIGSVTIDGRLAPIRSAIPSITMTRSEFDELGNDRIVDGLSQLPGATFARPDGGADSAIAVIALRGPDPSESLLALDGQLLNDGNTGDLDLSRFPVAAFSSVDVSEGLGPEDSNGSNTFGGSINLISLRPTKVAHQALSFSNGSFGQNEAWANATGTVGKLGYAAALDNDTESGFVNQTVQLYNNSDPTCSPCATHLGSSIASHLALGTLTYSFSQNADVTARIFALGDTRDQSGALNGIDDNAFDLGTPMYGGFIGPGEQQFAQDIRAYQLRGRTPLGAGELTADLSESDNSVNINGGAGSPYDVTHIDHRYNGGLTWQRTFAASQFAIGGYSRYESLEFEAPPANDGSSLTSFESQPILGQTINVLFARGGFQATPKVRLDGGVFESRYTTFGSNLDGRFSAIYSADPKTSVRFSLGTGFRAPLLFERYQFPYSQLGLDGNNVFVGQGSTGEVPEHATEYELGASHQFSPRSTLDVSLYQTNLRNPVEIFYPQEAVAAGACATNSYANPNPACVSYQSNVGNAVYQGAEFRYSQLLQSHLLATARYGINIAYPKDLNAQFSNPTSGGNLVDNAQFPGIPQQQASLQFEYDDRTAWHASASSFLRGKNNELSQGPFAIVDGTLGRRIGRNVDLSLSGKNLFNAESGRFTEFGAGEPYRGVVGEDAGGAPLYGALPTDALFIEPIGVRLILTLQH